MSADEQWPIHLTSLDREKLGDDRATQLLRIIRELERRADAAEAKLPELAEAFFRLKSEFRTELNEQGELWNNEVARTRVERDEIRDQYNAAVHREAVSKARAETAEHHLHLLGEDLRAQIADANQRAVTAEAKHDQIVRGFASVERSYFNTNAALSHKLAGDAERIEELEAALKRLCEADTRAALAGTKGDDK